MDTKNHITSEDRRWKQMTETQKEQIRAMRMQGIGYRLIAKSLGLKINQVQLFCKAHGLEHDSIKKDYWINLVQRAVLPLVYFRKNLVGYT